MIWAGGFLDYWCSRAIRSRLKPMITVAGMLRAHEPLILHWFRAKGEISNGAAEGPQQRNPSSPQAILRLSHLRNYGTRLVYHNLGRLPEREFTHNFC